MIHLDLFFVESLLLLLTLISPGFPVFFVTSSLSTVFLSYRVGRLQRGSITLKNIQLFFSCSFANDIVKKVLDLIVEGKTSKLKSLDSTPDNVICNISLKNRSHAKLNVKFYFILSEIV